MSLTPKGRRADSSFELVRQSLLQGDSLPFQEALTVTQMRQAFDAEGVSFGESDDANEGGANDDGANDDGANGGAIDARAGGAGDMRQCHSGRESFLCRTRPLKMAQISALRHEKDSRPPRDGGFSDSF